MALHDPSIEIPQDQHDICQICRVPLGKLNLEVKQAHYDHHFGMEVAGGAREPSRQSDTNLVASNSSWPTAEQMPSASTIITGSPGKSKVMPARQNVFWYCGSETNPPGNFTPGLVQVLKRALIRSHGIGATRRATLCYDGVVHVATEWWDIGWGCGYRNFLMACTALMNQQHQPFYLPLLDEPILPGVRNLQQWLENAWAAGFDIEGARQLKHKLVDTKKWIGTAELYVAFASRGIPVRLVDFPKSNRGSAALIDWVVKYFATEERSYANVNDALMGSSPIVVTEKMPLILQHQGHSRTIVGYETTSTGQTNLLLFDPSRKPFEALRTAALFQHHPDRNPDTNSTRHSPKKAIQNMWDSSVKKRKRSSEQENREPAGTDGAKRARGGLATLARDEGGSTSLNGRDPERALVPSKIIKSFSVNQAKLGKKDEYQVLWFPMTDPLGEQQMRLARVVKTERVA